jgi:hypothetical protein
VPNTTITVATKLSRVRPLRLSKGTTKGFRIVRSPRPRSLGMGDLTIPSLTDYLKVGGRRMILSNNSDELPLAKSNDG